MAAPTERAGHRNPRAKKRFGQNFLEPVWARKVVAAIAPRPTDLFVEIGPGPGAITRPLSEAASALIACEIDRDLAAALREEALPKVHVIEADFLQLSRERLIEDVHAVAAPGTPIRVAGNLPYNVASPIMFRLLDLSRQGVPLQDATIMLQREVADRLLAVPGSTDYGLLTVLVGHRATVSRLLNLPPGAFRPAPKVQSSVVRLGFHPPEPPVTSEPLLAAVTGAVFSRRRKTLGNALLAYGGLTPTLAADALAAAGIDPTRRGETLTIAEFVALANAVGVVVNATRAQSPPIPVL